MKIAFIYNKSSELTTGVYMERVLKNCNIPYDHFWTEKSAEIPREYDLYFRVDHGDYKYDICEDMYPSVFYAIDTHLKKPYKKIKRQSRHYDIVFCHHKPGAERLKKETKNDIHWVSIGGDPDLLYNMKLPKNYDIGFVGRDAADYDRGRHLKLLKEKCPNSFIGEAPHADMSKIYSQTKIGFNSSIRNDITMRIFEIMCCGTFLLTNKIKNPALKDLFEDGKHIVTYTSDKDMLEKVEYYLSHDEEREAIAVAGQKLVIENYTYFHMMQQMFNYIAFKFGGKYNQLRI